MVDSSLADRVADLSGVRLELVDSVDQAAEMMRWLGERRPDAFIAVDTETGEYAGNDRSHALSPWHGRLRLAQVGDSMTSWAIPWRGWEGVFSEAMRKWDREIICHNVAFEAKWFDLQSDWKIPWNRTHDTMIAAQIINPLESAALKNLSSRLIDPRAAALQGQLDIDMATNGWTWGTIPVEFQPYWAYGALDSILTSRLWELFRPQVTGSGEFARAYDLEMGARRVATMMELNGARVDLDYSRRKYTELFDYSEQVRQWFRDTYGVSNVGSNPQLAQLLTSKGAVLTETTNSGALAVDKDVLAWQMVNGSDEVKVIADSVLKMRKAQKLATTYFQNFLERNQDGIVHPSIMTMGARTGRMSIRDPALQTLPKGDAVVRHAFIPKKDDHVILTSDLDQVEFRMFASMSQDPQLTKLFIDADAAAAGGDEDADAFTYIMREVYNAPGAHKSDKRRKLVKGMIYGRLYGAGVAKQAVTAGVPEEQMRALSEAFDSRYPGVTALVRKIEDIGMRRLREEGTPYITTGYGRKLPAEESKCYRLTNYLIQGGAAEVFKANLLRLDAAGLTEFMLVPVHDEIVLSVPKKDAEDVSKVVQDCMTTRSGWAVPLTAGVKYGDNWGDLID